MGECIVSGAAEMLGEVPAGKRRSAAPSTEKEVVLRLESVSLRYRVPRERILSFKEYVIQRLRGEVAYWDLWALRDVSLTVCRGQVFGVIGRNGAGKSTLLKVVARVLRPTSGRVWVRGRVVPLLEIGAGFHPELTGRENVYLNATLLGHSRREIDAAFQTIVEFAELWDFIDAPVRTYSTGMVARLGFAVATAWKPEILMLDEVLAVGDEAFQRKCRSRLNTFRQDGATILLVSHDMAQVQDTCEQAIWLEHGTVKAVGPVGDVVRAYQTSNG